MAFRASPVNLDLINLVRFALFPNAIISLALSQPSRNTLKGILSPLNPSTIAYASYNEIDCATIATVLELGVDIFVAFVQSSILGAQRTSDPNSLLKSPSGIDLVGVKGSNASTSLLSFTSLLAKLRVIVKRGNRYRKGFF